MAKTTTFFCATHDGCIYLRSSATKAYVSYNPATGSWSTKPGLVPAVEIDKAANQELRGLAWGRWNAVNSAANLAATHWEKRDWRAYARNAAGNLPAKLMGPSDFWVSVDEWQAHLRAGEKA